MSNGYNFSEEKINLIKEKNRNYWIFCALLPSYAGIILITYLSLNGEKLDLIYKTILSFLIIIFLSFSYFKVLNLKKTDLITPIALLLIKIIIYYLSPLFIISIIFILIFIKNKIKYLIGFLIYLFFLLWMSSSIFIIILLKYITF